MALELPTTNGAWQYSRVQYAKTSQKIVNSDKLILIVQNLYFQIQSRG